MTGTDAASGGVTPDLTTLIHDRHQIGSGCCAVQGNRTIKEIRMNESIKGEKRASAAYDPEWPSSRPTAGSVDGARA